MARPPKGEKAMTNAERQRLWRERQIANQNNEADSDDTAPSSSTALVSHLNARRKTSIEWTQETINPFVGCTRVSEGCRNCYAEIMAARQCAMGTQSYIGTINNRKWTGVINKSSETTFHKPLEQNKPTVYFVNSMSDFWHENAKDEWRNEFIDVIKKTPHHIYQILTKRPENIITMMDRIGLHSFPDNVWIGATVEDHRVAHRIDNLRSVPARIRFLSVEPMTAPLGNVNLTGIHWVITGGEAGPGARPCKVEWIREVRDQCERQGVPFFHKQWGTPESNPLAVAYPGKEVSRMKLADFIKNIDPHAKGGAFLDGRLWRDMPKG